MDLQAMGCEYTDWNHLVWFKYQPGVGYFIEPYDFYEDNRVTKQMLDT